MGRWQPVKQNWDFLYFSKWQHRHNQLPCVMAGINRPRDSPSNEYKQYRPCWRIFIEGIVMWLWCYINSAIIKNMSEKKWLSMVLCTPYKLELSITCWLAESVSALQNILYAERMSAGKQHSGIWFHFCFSVSNIIHQHQEYWTKYKQTSLECFYSKSDCD